MSFHLIIIGDEILHGSRQDKHFAFFKSLLAQYGLQLGLVQYLPDDRPLLVAQLQRSFSDGLPTFVTGGIGATPDDHTRQAAAQALNLPLQLHPEGIANIEAVSRQRGDTFDSSAHRQRLRMAEFPAGADLIPNAYNGIAGFSICEHYFLPGFPIMAHPMAEWVLNTYYAALFHQTPRSHRAIWLFDLPESHIAPVMEAIEKRYPGIHSYSLPTEGGMDDDGRISLARVEFGLKAEGAACAHIDAAWEEALQQLQAAGGRLVLMK
ncbi:molybdopterin-binding protein [Uruburuella testudinis]|uniref:Molybdopterin-binding protein n=1 Tax=Uruburuella testudinis TaxID=1282863 RepID=A0ABY4DU05_9NEIS|nr:molybdopterin-binding protein [Uruburuella testudinis]UOO82520.1 molybdopterin-binding protein [Uruburuella testudinis]